MGKIIVVVAVTILLLSIPLSIRWCHGRVVGQTTPPNWQSAMTPEVQLGVRDKFGAQGPYTAVFLVTAPNGTTSRALQRPNDYGWCYVNFPADFQGFAPPGTYLWRAEVNGNIVVRGQFHVTSNGILVD